MRRALFFMVMLGALAIPSCLPSKDFISNFGVKSSTSILIEQLENMRQLTEVLKTIKDDKTADEVMPQIREIVTRARKNRKIPLAEQARLMRTFKDEVKEVEENFDNEMNRISKLPNGKTISGKLNIAIRN